MAQVIIRNLDPKVVEALRARARRNGRSLEAELRLVLARASGVASAVVAETGPEYRASIAVSKAAEPAIRLPLKKVKFKPFKPIKVKGKSLSEQLLEDRRESF